MARVSGEARRLLLLGMARRRQRCAQVAALDALLKAQGRRRRAAAGLAACAAALARRAARRQ